MIAYASSRRWDRDVVISTVDGRLVLPCATSPDDEIPLSFSTLGDEILVTRGKQLQRKALDRSAIYSVQLAGIPPGKQLWTYEPNNDWKQSLVVLQPHTEGAIPASGWEIWSVEGLSGAFRELSGNQHRRRPRTPSMSGDRQRIVYVDWATDGEGTEIWVCNADGTHSMQLTHFNAELAKAMDQKGEKQ